MTGIGAFVGGELTRFVEPLRLMAGGPTGVQSVMGSLGWDLANVGGQQVDDIVAAARSVLDAVDELEGATGEPSDLAAVFAQLESIRAALSELSLVASAIGSISLDPPTDTGELVGELIGGLTLQYLRARSPAMFQVARLLRLIDGPADAAPTPLTVLSGTDVTVRWPRTVERLRLDRLTDLITDPGSLLGGYYAPGGLMSLTDSDDVQRLLDRVGLPFGQLAYAVRGRTVTRRSERR